MSAQTRYHVVVPGIWGSDDDHWQSRWERSWGTDALRIAPASWDRPDVGDWGAAITRAVRMCPEPPVLVAHSLGCLAVAAWLPDHDDEVAGAFLVAPPDPEGPEFPAGDATGFRMPDAAVSTPTVLVISDDDPYCAPERAAAIAIGLGAAIIRVGPLGHVNVAAGVGAWDRGRELLAAFESDLPRAVRRSATGDVGRRE